MKDRNALAAHSLQCAALLATLAVTTLANAQQIPPLATLSDAATAAYPELVKHRAALVKERDELRENLRRHNSECSAVEEGSAAEAPCRRALDSLKTEAGSHIERSNTFNAEVAWVEASLSTRWNGAKRGIGAVYAGGEYYILTGDGHKLTGQDVLLAPLLGSRMVTGADGYVQLRLPDNTVFVIGPNSDIVIDEFVYDPASGARTITARLAEGTFRWATGTVARKDLANMKMVLPAGEIGPRGTDFEATVFPDKSGGVVLFSGQLEIAEKLTGRVFLLNAGEYVAFGQDGVFSRPKKANE